MLHRALATAALAARVAPRMTVRAPIHTSAVRLGFWDNVLPLIQGNRRERQLQRKQGGLLPEDYERIREDDRRNAMLASQSSDGEALIDDTLDLPEFRGSESTEKAAAAKREKRLLRKRWGGLDAPGGVEKAEHKYSTAMFRISHRKLNLLARQISGKPIGFAILQMEFSAKRAARRVRSTLALARDHAEAKGMDANTLVVSEAWVTKGKYIKRVEIKGRARYGLITHPQARLNIVLRPGKTHEQVDEERIEKARRHVRSIGSGGLVRTNRRIINGFQRPGWAW
ncbi:hypothetical protein MCUN1_003259 [Malassezia cuniculi]|uniref:50S ribosomal protein L22 n=1 Tax=Malassezia cuniculi TaxID=948313 RepID=A0AAF0EWL7_9BASI|nr:hypothetical protein MCUN1_003259 [Malassezia cuniculi]